MKQVRIPQTGFEAPVMDESAPEVLLEALLPVREENGELTDDGRVALGRMTDGREDLVWDTACDQAASHGQPS